MAMVGGILFLFSFLFLEVSGRDSVPSDVGSSTLEKMDLGSLDEVAKIFPELWNEAKDSGPASKLVAVMIGIIAMISMIMKGLAIFR